jgi:hypothetical protein
LANNSLTESARSRPGHVEPLHILNIPATVADKVVVPQAFGIKARRAALNSHFPHQTRVHQVPQIVVRRSP